MHAQSCRHSTSASHTYLHKSGPYRHTTSHRRVMDTFTSEVMTYPTILANSTDTHHTGLLGGLIGGIGSGKLCDSSSRTFARWNKGIYEPEFRIPVQVIAAVLLGIGYFVFMWDMENPTPKGYYLGAFCHGCICCGITVTSSSASLYIL